MSATQFDPARCETAGVTLAEADCLVFIEQAGSRATHEIRRQFGPVVGRGIREKGLARPRSVHGPAQPGDVWDLTPQGAVVLERLRADVGGIWPRALPPDFLPAPSVGRYVLVRIEHASAYRAWHGLRVVRGFWESGASEPTLEVEPDERARRISAPVNG